MNDRQRLALAEEYLRDISRLTTAGKIDVTAILTARKYFEERPIAIDWRKWNRHQFLERLLQIVTRYNSEPIK